MIEAKRVLVCANPDLNCIDGSSIWAQTLALALAETGQASVDFLSRCVPERDQLFSPLIRHPRINVINGPAQERGRSRAGQVSMSDMARIAVALDGSRDYDLIIVRGYRIAQALKEDAPVLAKCWLYLTDIPQDITAYDSSELDQIEELARGCHRLLCQSQGFVRLWKSLVPDISSQKFLLFTPVIPDINHVPTAISDRERIAIYAGKFAPDWKTLEMAELWKKIHKKYPDATLRMIGDKIHSDNAGFKSHMFSALTRTPGLEWLGAMTREDVQNQLGRARVGLSWRSEVLNDTLEYSTKILEYGGAGCAAILNLNPLHENLLGEDYPLFANSRTQYLEALETALENDVVTQIAADRLMEVSRQHLFSHRVQQLDSWLKQLPDRQVQVRSSGSATLRVLVAGHDLKFFKPLQRRLEESGCFEFITDHWQGHAGHDPSRSQALLEKVDVIFCEWCLGNVEWYSQNKRPGQRLFVRFHAQELKTNHLEAAEWKAIDVLAFVAPHIQKKFRTRYPSFPQTVQTVIPNFVDSREFEIRPKLGDAQFTLGILGYVPKLKRLDRAVDLLEKLLDHDSRFKLRVKGRSPFEYPWMRSRNDEQAYYETLFERINCDPKLRNRVIFDPHGDDVNEWFQLVGHVLSPSDRESFHLALAEGALTGCNPIIWHRDGVAHLWPSEFVCTDTESAASMILEAIQKPTNFRETIEKSYTDSVVKDWQRHLLNSGPAGKAQSSIG